MRRVALTEDEPLGSEGAEESPACKSRVRVRVRVRVSVRLVLGLPIVLWIKCFQAQLIRKRLRVRVRVRIRDVVRGDKTLTQHCSWRSILASNMLELASGQGEALACQWRSILASNMLETLR